MNLIPLILPDGFVCPFIELANTDELRRRGLAGRDSIGPGAGMFFPFGLRSDHPMRMLGCLVPLDIIWLGQGGRVLQVVTAPTDGPQTSGVSHWWEADGESWAVLELAAGQAAAHGVIPGSKIRSVTPSS